MSSSNCYFLTCIQVSQETCQVVWYSHLFQNFPQFIVIHTVKGFGVVNKAEIDVFLELSCFYHDPADVGNLISGSSAFSNTCIMARNLVNFIKCFLCTWKISVLCTVLTRVLYVSIRLFVHCFIHIFYIFTAILIELFASFHPHHLLGSHIFFLYSLVITLKISVYILYLAMSLLGFFVCLFVLLVLTLYLPELLSSVLGVSL